MIGNIYYSSSPYLTHTGSMVKGTYTAPKLCILEADMQVPFSGTALYGAELDVD